MNMNKLRWSVRIIIILISIVVFGGMSYIVPKMLPMVFFMIWVGFALINVTLPEKGFKKFDRVVKWISFSLFLLLVIYFLYL